MTPQRAEVNPWCATCPPGNLRSNWLCETCRNAPENEEWALDPRWEVQGFEADRFGAGAQKFPEKRRVRNGRTKYDSDAARKVVKAIALGDKLRDAAETAGVGIQYAKKISAYWRREVGMKLKAIAKSPKKEP